MVVLPHVLPAIAGMRKKGLKLLLGVLTLTSLAAKVGPSGTACSDIWPWQLSGYMQAHH
jgi:hypothetical protein